MAALDTTLDYHRPHSHRNFVTNSRSYKSDEGDGECARCSSVTPRNHRVGYRTWHILSTTRQGHFHEVTLATGADGESTVHKCSCEHGFYAGLRGQAARCCHIEIAQELLRQVRFGPLWRTRSLPGQEGVELFQGDELPETVRVRIIGRPAQPGRTTQAA